MNRSWKTHLASLCHDAWHLGPRRTEQVVEGIDFLIASDQLSELAIAGVLSTVGMADPLAGAAARSIRAAVGDTSRPADRSRASPSPARGSRSTSRP